MSLPPAFLDELRTRTSLAQVVGRKVVWDMRKSNQGKGDWWAPCPFHQEKSASFHVDDRKGFYYCFGCQASGDAVKFLRETEAMSFREAVEALAREAGMEIPARDPQATQRDDRRGDLSAVIDEAVRWFRLQLKTAAGQGARDYLAGRRLTPEAQDRWEIGYAPDSGHALTEALGARGIAPELVIAAGLRRPPEDGRGAYDRFRARIIFPIRDAQGRAISLGGRAMEAGAQAKYLNGPETELFDKGRSLFNHGPARRAAAKGAPLIVAEGYMDTIALVEAGFGCTVAPLGTAITEDQLRLLWRIHPEPIVALDGDTAGQKAALRLIDLALPLLEAGRGLRFAVLPAGLDPDDLIRQQGAPAMQRVIDAAQPMVNLLWQRETEGRSFDSPERRATLDKTLREVLARISDASIRGHYAEEIKRLRQTLFGGPPRAPWVPGQGKRGGRFVPPPLPPRSVTRASALAGGGAEEEVLEAVLLATLVTHPALVARHESALEALEFGFEDHHRLRLLLLRHAHADDPRSRVAAEAGELLETLFARSHVRSAPPVRNAGDADLAMMCVAEGLAKLEARRGVLREIEDAMEDMTGLADEGVTWRLGKAAEAVRSAERPPMPEVGELGEDRSAMSEHLQSLIDGQVWRKKP